METDKPQIKYSMIYRGPGIQFREFSCRSQGACRCSSTCGLTLDEVREQMADYYRRCLSDLSKLSDDDLMREFGVDRQFDFVSSGTKP